MWDYYYYGLYIYLKNFDIRNNFIREIEINNIIFVICIILWLIENKSNMKIKNMKIYKKKYKMLKSTENHKWSGGIFFKNEVHKMY